MASDAGSSVARRRRRFPTAFQLSVSHLQVLLFLHEFLVFLGYLISLAVVICERCVQYRLYILWLLCSPSPFLMAAIVSDLCQKTCNPPLVCASEISDLKLTRRAQPSSSPKTMTFLPLGKIVSKWFWCKKGSCKSPLSSLLARSMSFNDSQHFYRTIRARNLLQALATHTDDCSLYLSGSDLNDQRLSFGPIKPLLLQHGNAGVGRLWLDSTLVPSEISVKTISMSADTKNPLTPLLTNLVFCLRGQLRESSKDSQNGFVYNYWLGLPSSICRPNLGKVISRQCLVSSPNLRFPKLNSNSLLKLSFVDKFKQPSSRQGRERSLSTSSFSKERLFPLNSLFVRGDHIPASKTGKIYQLSSRLLSCVKVRLGPVDTTIFISMRVEVLDGIATSHFIVTNRSLLEDFEVRLESFIDWIASGSFDIFYNILSNLYKFVSLSLSFVELYIWTLASRLAHHDLSDDATIVIA